MNEATRHQLRLIREVPELVRHVGPLWLMGGWAVDFLTGRIRRPHDDIDWVALLPLRPAILSVLAGAGFGITHDLGWHTRLTRDTAREYGEVELNFLQELDETPYLVVMDDADKLIRPGRYRFPKEMLDPGRIRELHGVQALVTSPLSELAFRVNYAQLRVQPDTDPKYESDTEALRRLLSLGEQEEAKAYFKREPLTDSEQEP